MPRPLADQNFGRTHPLEHFHGRYDHSRVGVDAGGGIELHQIRLQQHPLASHVETALGNTTRHLPGEAGFVVRGLHHRDRRGP